MKEQCYLGIDFGAESGRVMAGRWDGRAMRLEEIHRFPNGAVEVDGTLRWDIRRLWMETERGLGMAASKLADAIVSIGADTWALDYVLLDAQGELLEQPWHYRDARSRGMVEKVKSRVSHERIFAESGVQFMEVNTLFQLLGAMERDPRPLQQASRFLMIPDFVHLQLCGAKVSEFSNATTTQFFHPVRKSWSTDLLQALGLPTRFLPEVVMPGTKLGPVLPELRQRTGIGPNVEVIAPATHDTGSAVAGLPLAAGSAGTAAYLSSGTWSLLGVELPEPNLSAEAFAGNFTNEGGIDGTYRFLKNIMGLWLVQQCRVAFAKRGGETDYGALVRAAEGAPAFRSLIDPDDACFLNPPEMPEAIASFCRETNQPAPSTEGEFVRCALESLALKYAFVLERLEQITGLAISVLHIVGGGSRNRLLNQFTADACGIPVLAGPAEGTVLGNLLVQARTRGEIGSLDELHAAARASSEVEQFLPSAREAWVADAERFRSILQARR